MRILVNLPIHLSVAINVNVQSIYIRQEFLTSVSEGIPLTPEILFKKNFFYIFICSLS